MYCSYWAMGQQKSCERNNLESCRVPVPTYGTPWGLIYSSTYDNWRIHASEYFNVHSMKSQLKLYLSKSLVLQRLGMPLNFYDTMKSIKHVSTGVFRLKLSLNHGKATKGRLFTFFPVHIHQKMVIFQYCWKYSKWLKITCL